MPDKSKFEREIDEILEKSDTDRGSKGRNRPESRGRQSFEPFSPSVPKSGPVKRSRTRFKLNSGYLIFGGLILLAVAAFSSAAQLPLAIAGLALLVAGYMSGIRGGSRGGSSGTGSLGGMFGRGRGPRRKRKSEPEVKYWRGRRIEEKPEQREGPGRPGHGGRGDDRGKIIDFGSPQDDDGDSGDGK